MSHKCPADGCPQRVADHMLICRPHWYMVPREQRDSVWDAWQDGAGAGTKLHMSAIRAAVQAVNEKIAAKQ